MSLSTAHLCTIHVSQWVFSSCLTAWVLNLGDSVSRSWGPSFEWTKHGHPTVAARNLAPPAMYKTTWKHIKTHKKVGYTVEPIPWCRISSNNMAMATLKCIIWAALRTAGRNTSKIKLITLEVSVLFSDKFAAAKWMSSTACNSELPRTASNCGNVAPFRMITSHKGATNADNTTPQASLEKTSQKVTQPEIGDESLTSNFLRNISFTALMMLLFVIISATSSLQSVGWLRSPGNVNCHLHPLMSFDVQLDWDSSNHRVWRRAWIYHRKMHKTHYGLLLPLQSIHLKALRIGIESIHKTRKWQF